MSGHSKWANIKHKKGAADAKKGRIFSKLAKEIMVAVKQSGKEPDTNPKLRLCLAEARAANMPRENIDRAIKKGAGELGDVNFEEITYEGYGPAGTAIIVECLTDNKNRTLSDVRLVFDRNNGNMGATGSVAWMFQRKAHFLIEGENATEEKLMDLALENGADDLEAEDGIAEIWAETEAFENISKALENAGITPSEAGIVRKPDNTVAINELDKAQQILRLIDKLEDLDDVQKVTSNVDISDEVMEKIEEQED